MSEVSYVISEKSISIGKAMFETTPKVYSI